NTKVIVTRPLESDGIQISGDGLTETGGDVQKSVNLSVGQGVRLYADVTKDITDSAVLKWKSSKGSVKVSPQGYVIAVKPVKNNQPVTVTASLGKAKKSVTVNVTDPTTYMTMPKAAYTVKPGKKGAKLTIKPACAPKNLVPVDVKWSVTTESGTPVTDESVRVTPLEKGRGRVEVSSTAVRMTYYVTAVMEGLEPTTAELVVK
ncbi:MAG: hypothetical protein K6E33_04150, partial [Lachnospiraceae bacterium]|nr:hypothetical protein [Lachnospiraceae bacterium]